MLDYSAPVGMFFWIAVRGGEWRASETTAFVPKGMGMGCIWKSKLELSWALVEADSDLSEERKGFGSVGAGFPRMESHGCPGLKASDYV